MRLETLLSGKAKARGEIGSNLLARVRLQTVGHGAAVARRLMSGDTRFRSALMAVER